MKDPFPPPYWTPSMSLHALRMRLLLSARFAVRTGREIRAERILERLAKVEGLIACAHSRGAGG
jgi:hypothetical protein